MKIVIDARMYQESGIGRYIRNLIGQLQEIDQENEYSILHLEKDLHGLNYTDNFQGIGADFGWYGMTEQIRLPKLLESLKADLVHFPHFNVPLLYRGKFVVTIHDLIHQHFSMKRATTHGVLLHKIKQVGYKKVFKNAVSRSENILAPSDYVRRLLVGEWNTDQNKVIVTPEAVDEGILERVQMSNDKCQKILERLNIRKPYIFYVGNAHPHKNVEGLIRVFGELREKYPDLSLVLSGSDHYFWQRIEKMYPSDGIIYTGKVSDEELVALYKNARCFVMPSLEEGFGIPLLEAMACECPVVSSNAGSLPEVGGVAAIYFDPASPEDMADKIEKVLISEELRKELVDKGKKSVKDFSWKKLAEQTLEVYRTCG